MFKSRNADELYRHLNLLGNNLVLSVTQFESMVQDWDQRRVHLQAIQASELEGDRLMRDLRDNLKDTFFVPGDRAAVYAVTNELDDIVDRALKISDYMLLYKVDVPPQAFGELAAILKQCASRLQRALTLLPERKRRAEVNQLCLEVVDLQGAADDIHHRGLTELFDHPQDLIALLKWKDLYDWVEDAVDHANHVAYRLIALNGALH